MIGKNDFGKNPFGKKIHSGKKIQNFDYKYPVRERTNHIGAVDVI
jgi:hypothetical protein